MRRRVQVRRASEHDVIAAGEGLRAHRRARVLGGTAGVRLHVRDVVATERALDLVGVRHRATAGCHATRGRLMHPSCVPAALHLYRVAMVRRQHRHLHGERLVRHGALELHRARAA